MSKVGKLLDKYESSRSSLLDSKTFNGHDTTNVYFESIGLELYSKLKDDKDFHKLVDGILAGDDVTNISKKVYDKYRKLDLDSSTEKFWLEITKTSSQLSLVKEILYKYFYGGQYRKFGLELQVAAFDFSWRQDPSSKVLVDIGAHVDIERLKDLRN